VNPHWGFDSTDDSGGGATSADEMGDSAGDDGATMGSSGDGEAGDGDGSTGDGDGGDGATSTGDGDGTSGDGDGTTSTGDGDGSSGDGDGTTSTGDGDGTTSTGDGDGDGSVEIRYPVLEALCVDESSLDPAACEAVAAANVFIVDADDTMLGGRIQGYLAFDLDSAFAAGTVVGVRLEVRTHNNNNEAATDSSPDCWEVAAFPVIPGVWSAFPAQLRGAPLASGGATLMGDQPVVYDLPTDVVAPGARVHLGLLPTTTDGTDIWDEGGPQPPELVVTYVP
jgi:hypothetical protein